MSINIGEGVFDFSKVAKELGDDIVAFFDKVNKGVVFDEFGSEFHLVEETGVSIS